jgi:hypothetical protein
MQWLQESHTEELVIQAKSGPKLVPTVLHSPPPLPHTIPTHHLSEFSSRGTRARVKPPSRQVHPTQNHHTLNSYFCIFFKVCGPTLAFFAHYSPQAPTILTCLVYVAFEQGRFKSECQYTRNCGENNRYICVTRIPSFANCSTDTFWST